MLLEITNAFLQLRTNKKIFQITPELSIEEPNSKALANHSSSTPYSIKRRNVNNYNDIGIGVE